MRLVSRLAPVVLVALFAVAASAAPERDRAAKAFAGDWDMVIASPRRPWIFLVRLRPAGANWTGTLSVAGLADFPLREVRADSGAVHFQLPRELDSAVFDGTLGNEGIVGAVSRAATTTPARLTRVVALPAPANRVQAWQQDLDFAAAHLSEYDRSFTARTREEFQRALAQLKPTVTSMNDAEILVALSRAVALSGNAHTRLRLDPTRQGSFSTTLPIRIWWFSDGPYVMKAAPEYRRALRCRVIAIDGHALLEARDRVRSLFAGNAQWGDYLSPIYLTSPDILYGLGLIRSPERASFTLEDAKGSRFELEVRSARVDRSAMPDESWQELSPLVTTGKPVWATALVAKPDSLPLYLRHPRQPYWFEFRPETGRLYFQLNRSGDSDEGPSFKEFGDSLTAFVDRHPVRDVVVDLRLNSGGDLDVAQAFMKSLGQNQAINRRGRLFVIIGRCTFSAGLYHAAQLRQFTQATFVGEPVGDRLDFWAEGGELVLPNSHAVISYANGFHRYSTVDYPEYQPYYEELRIASLEPDVPAPLSSADYFSGRDPALEAIEARIRP
jgi:hypothetical protein